MTANPHFGKTPYVLWLTSGEEKELFKKFQLVKLIKDTLLEKDKNDAEFNDLFNICENLKYEIAIIVNQIEARGDLKKQ